MIAQHEPGVDDPTCFVIGPIGDRLSSVGSSERIIYEQAMQILETLIQPACAYFGIEPVRADQIAEQGEITEQVFRHLREDYLVIADLTGANPNVMYELGLRHIVAKPTVHLGEIGRVPFDLRMIRTVKFKRSETGLVEAREALRAAIKASLEGKHGLITPTRLWSETPELTLPGDNKVELAPELDEPGFLELMAEMETALPEMVTVMEEVGSIVQQLASVVVASSAELDKSDAAGGLSSGRLAVVIRLAEAMKEPADQMDGVTRRFFELVRGADPGMSYLIGRFEESPDELPNDLVMAVSGSVDSLRELATEIEQIEQPLGVLAGAARPLREPVRLLRESFLRIPESARPMEEWARRLNVIASDVN